MLAKSVQRCLLPSPEGILGLLVGVRIGWPPNHPSIPNDPSIVTGIVFAWSGAAVGGTIAGIRLACLGRLPAPWREVLSTALVWLPCGLIVGWAIAATMTSMKYYWLVYASLGLLVAIGIVIAAVTRNLVLSFTLKRRGKGVRKAL